MAPFVAASPCFIHFYMSDVNLPRRFSGHVFLSSSFASPTLAVLPSSARRCCCHAQSKFSWSGEDLPKWNSLLKVAAENVIQWWQRFTKSDIHPLKDKRVNKVEYTQNFASEKQTDWDWEQWKKHIDNVKKQEELISLLKSQLHDAVKLEAYKDAANLKVAVEDVERDDTVGQAICQLNSALKEERYQDAAFLNGHAGTWLLGWWAGVAEDPTNPVGHIICINAEHGKYVARHYSPRQLVHGNPGVPLFEVYFCLNNGKYIQQVVQLKWTHGRSSPCLVPALASVSNPFFIPPMDLSPNSENDAEERGNLDGDSDDASISGINSFLQDMFSGANLLKGISLMKLDKDLTLKHLTADMNADADAEAGEESDDDSCGDYRSEDDTETMNTEISGVDCEREVRRNQNKRDKGQKSFGYRERQKEAMLEIVIDSLVRQFSQYVTPEIYVRLPAKLEKRDNSMFTLCTSKESSLEKSADHPGYLALDLIMSELANVISQNKKIPVKVLRNIEELLNLNLRMAENYQCLSGSMMFSRIEMKSTTDPLLGLYIGCYGSFMSEIIQLKRKIGRWSNDKSLWNFEVYEYVEAVKLTGDLYIPAGQVAFRAKIGKSHQLPHRGVIPEELGVVARYRGQGRLAEPGFKNPRWADGELVILDGKHIKEGPIVGFIYWAVGCSFLVSFKRLNLPH